LNLQDKVVE